MAHGVVAGESGFEQRVRSTVDAHRGEGGALLPILHALMAEFGYVDPAAISILAEELNLSRAEVYGVVTFYRDFRTAPAGATTVRICRGEACQSVGADRLVEHARARYGVEIGQTTVDGSVTLEQVFCLGNCALGPSAQVGATVVGRLDAAALDDLVARAQPPLDAPDSRHRADALASSTEGGVEVS